MSTEAFCRLEEVRTACGDASPDGERAGTLWITWDWHRRTRELARALGVPLREIVHRGPRLVRHSVAAAATVAALMRTRPRVVFVQNPSLVLAALICALKPMLRYRVVVDRHSNFRFGDLESGLANRISDYSLRRADLTIVTNPYIERLVESKGGRAFVLPDKLPALDQARQVALGGRFNVAFVCTYSPDEPVREVIDAARLLDPDIRIHITGKPDALPASLRRNAPANVVFTGFLPEPRYQTLLASVDLVLELTTRDHTLLCGAYEAVSLGKPLIISRKEALMQYFHRGVVVTDNRAEAIADAVKAATADLDRLRRDISALREELGRDWAARFCTLCARLDRL